MNMQVMPSPDQFILVIYRHQGQAELWFLQSGSDGPSAQDNIAL